MSVLPNLLTEEEIINVVKLAINDMKVDSFWAGFCHMMSSFGINYVEDNTIRTIVADTLNEKEAHLDLISWAEELASKIEELKPKAELFDELFGHGPLNDKVVKAINEKFPDFHPRHELQRTEFMYAYVNSLIKQKIGVDKDLFFDVDDKQELKWREIAAYLVKLTILEEMDVNGKRVYCLGRGFQNRREFHNEVKRFIRSKKMKIILESKQTYFSKFIYLGFLYSKQTRVAYKTPEEFEISVMTNMSKKNKRKSNLK